jgi:hypothetical protein
MTSQRESVVKLDTGACRWIARFIPISAKIIGPPCSAARVTQFRQPHHGLGEGLQLSAVGQFDRFFELPLPPGTGSHGL